MLSTSTKHKKPSEDRRASGSINSVVAAQNLRSGDALWNPSASIGIHPPPPNNESW